MYNKGNYTEIRRHLNLYSWKTVILNLNVNESWTYLQEQLDYLTKKYIPTKQYNTSKTYKKIWFNKKAMAKIQKKKHVFQRFLKKKQGSDYLKYTRAWNQARWECIKAT